MRMRKAFWLVLLLAPAVALARTSISFGRGGGHSGGRRGGGLNIRYHRTSGHSSFSLRFSGGTYYHGGSRSWGYPGSSYMGSSGYVGPGVYAYRGWTPYPPGWYSSSVPYNPDRAVGPFAYVDSVQFVGTGGVQLFGPRPPVTAMPARPEAVRIPPEYARLSARQLIDRGDDLFGRGRFAEAAVAYRAAAAKAPRDPMAAYALGHGLFAIGDYQGAADALRRGIQLFPGLLDVGMNRRDFYGNPARFDAQLAALARRVEAAPDDTAARFVLGYNYFFTPQRGRAREHLEAVSGQYPEARLLLQRIRPH